MEVCSTRVNYQGIYDPNNSMFNFYTEIPIEGIAFLATSVVMRLFIPAFSPPLFGIGLSLCATRLAINFLGSYDKRTVVELTKEACKFNRKYPKLQLITFLFTIVLSFFSRTLAFFAGTVAGSFGALLLDVENYKLMQQTDRKKTRVVS
jgi:hypothetical protein